MSTVLGYLGAVLSVVDPPLYDRGCQALHQIGQLSFHEPFQSRKDLMNILEVWKNPFTAISIISNRRTPPHTDRGGRHQWADILTSFGPYKNCRFDLPTLGIQLEYIPGSVVSVLSRRLPHGVKDWDGERVCIALYMKANVHDRLGVVPTPWNTRERIRKYFTR